MNEPERGSGPRLIRLYVQGMLFGNFPLAVNKWEEESQDMKEVTERSGNFGRKLDFSEEGALALEVQGIRKLEFDNGEATYFDAVTHSDEQVTFGKIARIPMLECGARYIIESKGRKATPKGSMYDVKVFKLDELEWNDLRGGIATVDGLISRNGA